MIRIKKAIFLYFPSHFVTSDSQKVGSPLPYLINLSFVSTPDLTFAFPPLPPLPPSRYSLLPSLLPCYSLFFFLPSSLLSLLVFSFSFTFSFLFSLLFSFSLPALSSSPSLPLTRYLPLCYLLSLSLLSPSFLLFLPLSHSSPHSSLPPSVPASSLKKGLVSLLSPTLTFTSFKAIKPILWGSPAAPLAKKLTFRG